MTLNEAAEKGISRLRRPMWDNQTYVRIDLVAGGKGPWLHLFDRRSQEAIGEQTPQSRLSFRDPTSDYEEYKGNIDQADLT